MSEFVIVFLQLAGVIAGLALMGAVIWTAQKDEFQGAQSFAPSRTRPRADRRVPAARRPAQPTRNLRPAYSRRR
ncbi:MAG TPA: hypothetical protein VFQ01_06655 [Nocardioides sp.]|jgi:hypothetical protein|nr:hypothetical protein [Nocardioides sp.]